MVPVVAFFLLPCYHRFTGKLEFVERHDLDLLPSSDDLILLIREPVTGFFPWSQEINTQPGEPPCGCFRGYSVPRQEELPTRF